MKYSRISIDESGDFPKLILSGHGDSVNHVHEIPVQALGDRMELFGLESADEALELIGRAARAPQAYTEYSASVVESYRKAVTAEAFAVINQVEKTGRPLTVRTLQARAFGAQPRLVFSVGAASSELLSKLVDRRDHALSSMGMSRYDRAPRMLASVSAPSSQSSPVAQALELDEDRMPELRELVDSVSHLVSGFRVQAAVDQVPEVAKAIDLMSRNTETSGT